MASLPEERVRTTEIREGQKPYQKYRVEKMHLLLPPRLQHRVVSQMESKPGSFRASFSGNNLLLDATENADYFLEALGSFFSNIFQPNRKVAFWPGQGVLIGNVAKKAIFLRNPGSLSWTTAS